MVSPKSNIYIVPGMSVRGWMCQVWLAIGNGSWCCCDRWNEIKTTTRMKTNLTFASMIAKFLCGIDIIRCINNDRGRVKAEVEELVFVALKVELKLVDHQTPFRRCQRGRKEDVNWACVWLGDWEKEEEKKIMLMNDRNQAKSLRIPDWCWCYSRHWFCCGAGLRWSNLPKGMKLGPQNGGVYHVYFWLLWAKRCRGES